MAGNDGGQMIVKKVDDQIVSFIPEPARIAHAFGFGTLMPVHGSIREWRASMTCALSSLSSGKRALGGGNCDAVSRS